MLKIILVDDEPFILQGLQMLIDWNEEGYEIAGAFSNGKEAYDYIQNNHVDLIISDIQMPVMTGLELLAKVSESDSLNARFALLTGYDDFGYAQRAIKYNCIDYILKPVQKEDILTLLRNVSKLECDRNRNIEKQKALEDAYLARNIMALIKGKYDENNIEYINKHLQLSGDIRYVDIEVVTEHIEEKEDSDLRIIQRQLYQTCKEIQKENPNHFVFDVSYDENSYDVGFIFCSNMASRLDMTDREFLTAMIVKLRTKMGRFVRMTCGKSISDISALAKSYSSCCMLNSIKGFHTEQNIYVYEDEVKVGANTSFLRKATIDEVIRAIETENELEITKSIEKLYSEKVTVDVGIDVIQLNVNYLLFQLIHLATEQDDNVNQEEVLQYISENSFEESFSRGGVQHMTRFALAYAEYLASLRKNISRGLIANIDREIESRYSESITLKSLGDQYYINSSYLGQIFRKAHGMSFKDYLTRIRVDKAAKMLLKTDDKINAIAENVGYNDSDYFIRKFIELKGCTPSKYRKNNSAR